MILLNSIECRSLLNSLRFHPDDPELNAIRQRLHVGIENETDPQLQRYRSLAHRLYVEEGAIEIDENAIVSTPDPEDDELIEGAYVQAWVWVDNPDGKGQQP